jgi:predicted metal-binding protein
MKTKVAVCECCRQKKTLEAAHQKGFERLDVIKRILDNDCTIIGPDVYRVDLVDFEKKFINAHQPYEDKFLFLCKDCHKKYDKGTQAESDQVFADVLANRKKYPTP